MITLCLLIMLYVVLIVRTRPDQSRAHHNSYKCSLQLAAHLVPVPDTPHLTGNRKGAVTGYDELLENGAMNGNIWYTGCLPVQYTGGRGV